MKRKALLLLVILGIIWQVGFGQERDSVGLQILQDSVLLFQDSIPIQDSIVFNQDSIYKELLGLKLDSLMNMKDSILFSLSNIENQIDSLEQLINNVIDFAETQPKIMLIEGIDWEFTVKSVDIYQNQIIIISNIKNLQGSDVRFIIGVELYKKEISKKNEKGTIPLAYSQKIENQEEDIVSTIVVDKKRWNIDNIALKINMKLIYKNKEYEPFNKVEWGKMRRKYMYLP